MLLIQKIHLTWHKNERGAAGEEARRRFPLAYSLDEKPFSGEATVHNLSFYQEGAAFIDSMQEERKSLKKYLPRLGFSQSQIQNEIQKRTLMMKRYEYQFYESISSLNLANLSLCYKKDSIEVVFFYDEHQSSFPRRRGHNKDFCNLDSSFYGKDILNEIAFVLSQNQYGRIIWNERRTDYDTGEWYYQLHIYNLFYLSNQSQYSFQKNFSKNIFTKNKPDFEYKQFASLY